VGDERSAQLEIHDLVDEVPGPAGPRRGSKWDVVIEQAVDHPGRWVPVTRPATFTTTTATWLRERVEGLEVEPRADKVYLRWDPERAADVEATE
jgi:hypothetical protein